MALCTLSIPSDEAGEISKGFLSEGLVKVMRYQYMYAGKHDADSTRHTRASALVLKYQSALRRAYAVALLRLVEG